MKSRFPYSSRVCINLLAGILACSPVVAQQDDDDDNTIILNPFVVSGLGAGYIGATPGGAQDINFLRSRAASGYLPRPTDFTAEGLFSEHDLQLETEAPCEQLLCVTAAAMEAKILQMPEATHLAQIGFRSGLKGDEWIRPPLNLVAVIDRSGSMDGQPLALVKDSLLDLLDRLGPADQLSIVTYGSDVRVDLEPIRTSPRNRDRIRTAIHNIESYGATYMEAGILQGLKLARRTVADFEGMTRLMLFTDEQPNVGRTDEGSFMSLAREASADGIGMTTIGVAQHFGAELAATISSVRGGNLFYFPDLETMRERFKEDFDLMVTELAYNLKMKVTPAAGYNIVGVFGIPGDLLEWEGDALLLEIETIFLSRNQGAIYVALGQNVRRGGNIGASIAEVELSFQEAGSKDTTQNETSVVIQDRDEAQEGLRLGEYLVNEFVSVRKALIQHHEEDKSERAYETLKELDKLIEGAGSEALKPERELVRRMMRGLALISNNMEEPIGDLSPEEEALLGHWEIVEHDVDEKEEWRPRYISFWPIGFAVTYAENEGVVTPANTQPFKIEEGMLTVPSMDPWDEPEEVAFTLASDQLTLSGGSVNLIFKRVDEDPGRYIGKARGQRDPVTGLPKRIKGKR